MAGENTIITAELQKKVYGAEYEKLSFDLGHLTRDFGFMAGKPLGDEFIFPVPLTEEHGRTYNGSAGGAATLNAPIPAVLKQAKVKGFEFFMRAALTHRLLHDSAARGEASFEAATMMILRNLQASAEFTVEHQMLYGQKGLGKVETAAAGVITIAADTWTPALWDGMENAKLEAWTTQAASATQHNADLTITAVDIENRQITVAGTSAAVAPNDWLYFKDARTDTAHKEFLGATSIASNTGSLFDIDAAAYSRWKGNSKTNCGTAVMAMYLSGLAKLAGRKMNPKQSAKLYVAPKQWERLNSDLAGARRYDGSYKRKGDNGFDSLTFYGVTGPTDFIPHPLLRDGDALAYGANNGFRVGSKELGWAKAPDGGVWRHVENTETYEARISYIMAPCLYRPRQALYFTGITTA